MPFSCVTPYLPLALAYDSGVQFLGVRASRSAPYCVGSGCIVMQLREGRWCVPYLRQLLLTPLEVQEAQQQLRKRPHLDEQLDDFNAAVDAPEQHEVAGGVAVVRIRACAQKSLARLEA